MSGSAAFSGRHYTLERDNRELQQYSQRDGPVRNYTLERDNRELQHPGQQGNGTTHYTLERDNRELQLNIKHVFHSLLYP